MGVGGASLERLPQQLAQLAQPKPRPVVAHVRIQRAPVGLNESVPRSRP